MGRWICDHDRRAAQSGRRGNEQHAELVQIEALIAAGKVRSTRIVRTAIGGRDTYRMQLVCDGHPTRRHPVGDGRVSFDLGPSEIAVAVAQPPSSSQPARPQASAHAEVSGAHQHPAKSQSRDATEPVGANFHHQPAHGAAHMSNETAARQVESQSFHGREDVK